MRPIHLTDLDAMVRVLLARPEAEWSSAARQIVNSARVSDKYRKKYRKPLLGHGLGTLSSAVSGMPITPVSRCDRQYRRCLSAVLTALD